MVRVGWGIRKPISHLQSASGCSNVQTGSQKLSQVSFWSPASFETQTQHIITLLDCTLKGELMLKDTSTLKHFLCLNHFLFLSSTNNAFLGLCHVSICFCPFLLRRMYYMPFQIPLSRKYRYLQTSNSQGFIATK